MQNYESLISEALEMGTSRAKYERLMQLIQKGKELAELKGWMQVYKTTYHALQGTDPSAPLKNIFNFLPQPTI